MSLIISACMERIDGERKCGTSAMVFRQITSLAKLKENLAPKCVPKFRHISIKDNQLTILDGGFLDSFIQLEKLYISLTRISTISKTAFKGTELKYLHVKSSCIDCLPDLSVIIIDTTVV